MKYMDHLSPRPCVPVKLEHEDQVCGWSWPIKLEHEDQEQVKLECESAASGKDSQNYISRTDGAQSNSEEVNLPCAPCGLVFLQWDLFQRHMINCHGCELDSCQSAGSLSLNVSDWQLQHVHSKKEFFLIEEDRQILDTDIAERPGRLDRFHAGSGCYQCDQCGHTSLGLTQLQEHVLQHVVNTQTTRAEQNALSKHCSPSLHKKKAVLSSAFPGKMLKEKREPSKNGLPRSMHKGVRKASTRALKKHKDAAGKTGVLEFSLLCPPSPSAKNIQQQHKPIKQQHKHMQQENKNMQQQQELGNKSNAHICHICSMTFSYRGNLLRHRKLHSRLARYKCELCGLSFCSSYNLQDHKETHKCSKTHHCRYCPATFSCKQNMRRHERTHTSQKPHLCEFCGTGFFYPWHLTEHQRTHTGEKPYICDFCNARFVLQGHLKKHRVIHTGERSYKCDKCSKTFSRQTNLYNHKKNRHKIS